MADLNIKTSRPKPSEHAAALRRIFTIEWSIPRYSSGSRASMLCQFEIDLDMTDAVFTHI
jgi:hypothetical protein